jgi:hypothetical protein
MGRFIVVERKKLLRFFLVLFLSIILINSVSALDVSVANSKDWKDVYSIMLSSAIDNNRAIFTNSESLTAITRVLSTDNDLRIFESDDAPFINNLEGQLDSAGYDILEEQTSSSFNLDLDPQTGQYYIFSEDNPRISISLAPLAVKENAWVLIVTEDNLGEIEDRISNADKVVGVGNFRRDFMETLEPHFTERINNEDVFEDSQEIATRFGIDGNMVIADGSFLEVEFFTTDNPVILSGPNKILDETYAFLSQNRVESVVVVGNQIAVVGEQIRAKSNKEISVFVKYGQGDAYNTGKVYALTVFPLPKSTVALGVDQAAYDPNSEQLVVYFHNYGNTGLYELTTLSVKNGDRELASASDPEVQFLGGGEVRPIMYDISIPSDEITNETEVEFYTSFGVYPSQLDNFLTMENKYGPPFRIKMDIEGLDDDPSILYLKDVTYYKNLKRVGVTVQNNGTNTVYYSAKIQNLIVNGLETNIFKQDRIASGQEKITYIPVALDEIDLQENDVFELTLTYGQDEEKMIKTIREDVPFKAIAGRLPLPVIIGIVVAALVIVAVIFVLIKKKKK